jgi:tagaturonate epimerase
MMISKYSFGIGDRFARQGIAQLKAFEKAQASGTYITPVWNKSYREHKTVGSDHRSVRQEADQAVRALQWQHPYLVDADHINLANVDGFLEHSDFFTIDVADFIGQKAPENKIGEFLKANMAYTGSLHIPGINSPFRITDDFIWHIGEQFLVAAGEASRVYRHILSRKGPDNFIAEISMDEVNEPQQPAVLFFILSALHFYEVNPGTIAPKFTGRFNKGVDYEGDLLQFEKEFEQDLHVIDYAVKEFGLPPDLKLSVHSGSDKFSIYPSIAKTIRKLNKGLHIKTAGTTWLEELAGLAISGREGLALAKAIYGRAYSRYDELTKPYAAVIDIDRQNLPDPATVQEWESQKFFASLRHVPEHPDFNKNFRQLLHVGYKVAAEYGNEFLALVDANEKVIGPLVTENLFDKHIRPLFID